MSETTAPRKTRTPFWDNARFAAIILVVAGHAIQRLTYDSDAAYAVYLAIYAFHMPAFAIMAGYFSKSGAPTSRQMARVLTDIVIPYLIFETIWSLLSWVIDGDPGIDPTQPSWTLWFLLALAIFRVALPYLALRTDAWPDKGGFNSGYYSNPEVDKLLEAARVATDQEKRAELYKRMQEIVQEDAPWVFVANWKQNAVTSEAVENFALQPSFFLLLDDVVKN